MPTAVPYGCLVSVSRSLDPEDSAWAGWGVSVDMACLRATIFHGPKWAGVFAFLGELRTALEDVIANQYGLVCLSGAAKVV